MLQKRLTGQKYQTCTIYKHISDTTRNTHHRHSRAFSVVNGIAEAELYDHKTKLRKKKTPNTIPGYRKAVINTLLFHRNPPIVLYRRAETYPDIMPRNTYSTSTVVIRAPRFGGDKKPRQANTSDTNVIIHICTPVPADTDNSII